METKVSNNIVEPRSYQLYGDDIESKQSVEPISIVAGTGPICGFNYIDISSNSKVVISGTNNPSLEGFKEALKINKNIKVSNKANVSGSVVNAYTTPDGLVHIAPSVITINNGPEGGWPDVTKVNPDKAVVFAVKAKHTYIDQDTDNDIPSQESFELTWVDDSEASFLINILQGTYEDILNILPSGWLNSNTETLIGLYMVGWNSVWESDGDTTITAFYKTLIKGMNYTMGFVPYNGTWPVKAIGMGHLDYMLSELKLQDLKDNLAKYIKKNDIVTDMIKDLSVTSEKIDSEAIEPRHISESLNDLSDYCLNIYRLSLLGTNDISITPILTKRTLSVFNTTYNSSDGSVVIDLRYNSELSRRSPYVVSVQYSIEDMPNYSTSGTNLIPLIYKLTSYHEDSGVTINGYDKLYDQGIKIYLDNIQDPNGKVIFTLWVFTKR